MEINKSLMATRQRLFDLQVKILKFCQQHSKKEINFNKSKDLGKSLQTQFILNLQSYIRQNKNLRKICQQKPKIIQIQYQKQKINYSLKINQQQIQINKLKQNQKRNLKLFQQYQSIQDKLRQQLKQVVVKLKQKQQQLNRSSKQINQYKEQNNQLKSYLKNITNGNRMMSQEYEKLIKEKKNDREKYQKQLFLKQQEFKKIPKEPKTPKEPYINPQDIIYTLELDKALLDIEKNQFKLSDIIVQLYQKVEKYKKEVQIKDNQLWSLKQKIPQKQRQTIKFRDVIKVFNENQINKYATTKMIKQLSECAL